MLNKNTLNSTSVNSNGDTTERLFGGLLVAVEQIVGNIYSGSMLTVEQSVGRIYSGSVLTVEQSVQFVNAFSGLMFTFTQSIQNRYSGSMFSINQKVKDAAILSNVDKFGFDCSIHVNGIEIPANKIHGIINITRSENNAALATFSIIPDSGALNLDSWRGKSVLIDIETTDGIKRLYTGTIDIPEIDMVRNTLTLRCTDSRNQQINKQFSKDNLAAIGTWSSSIFEEADDSAEELEYRLRTTTKTVDFDAYGNHTVSSYFPKSTPDFTLNAAEIYRRTPRLSLASRGRLVNKIKLEFKFRFTRLRHRERKFQLIGPTLCEALTVSGVSFLNRVETQSNIENFGWSVKKGSISFDPAPDAGRYYCQSGAIFWNPIERTGSLNQRRDENNNLITDKFGNPVLELLGTSVINHADRLALGANWTAIKRFVQDVEQTTNYTITAPQSIAQYGEIEKTQRNGHEIIFDSTDFERVEVSATPGGFKGGNNGQDYYYDKSGSTADLINAVTTATKIAITSIKKSHRDNYLEFETPIWPEIELKHTVQTTAGLIACRGKVTSIVHTIDISNRFAETAVKLGLSQSVGSATNSTLAIHPASAPLVGEISTTTFTMNAFKRNTSGSITTTTSGQNAQLEGGLITPGIDDESRNLQSAVFNEAMSVSIADDPMAVTL